MRQATGNLAHRRPYADHPGLLLQRYLIQQKDPEERRALLDAARQASRSESLCGMYSEAFARWTRSFPQDSVHRVEQFSTASRLVVGLGCENILEVGLRLHHTYGVPVIPGSALKGLASHYCYDVWGQRHDDDAAGENRRFRRGGDYHSLIFGTTGDGGVIVFHDAWITPASLREGSLRLDVMTPHHPKWQAGAAAPTDFDSPKPVSFLSVAGTFEVRLSWSGPAGTPPDQAEAWTTLAMQLLREALAEWGVGSKTSSGYGRVVPHVSLRSDAQRSTVAEMKAVALPTPGEIVDARLLEKRTKKGGWRAFHKESGLSGPIQNSRDVPGDKTAGDALRLIVAIANDRELAFRYPTPADEARAQRVPGRADPNRQRGPGKGGWRR